MKTWADLLPLVLPRVPGCPELVAEDEIRNAAIDFYQRSLAWRMWTPGVAMVAGQALYTPTLPAGAQMVRVHAATLAGSPLDVTTADAVDGSAGLPNAVYTDDLRKLGVWPIPGAAGALLAARVSLAPTESSPGIDDALFDQHRLGIASGAISRIAGQAGKPYTNGSVQAEHDGRFEAAIVDARSRAGRGNSSARRRVSGVFF